MQVGPKDVENKVAVLARRDLGTKETVPQTEIGEKVLALLADIQTSLLQRVSFALTFFSVLSFVLFFCSFP